MADTFYLPLYHRLAGDQCLVVGGGQTALRKIKWLVKAGAHITVVAPQLCDGLTELVTQGSVQHVNALYDDSQVHTGLALVVSAANSTTVNQQVYQRARALGVAVNCVDDLARCSVIFPAIVDRSPIVVAISSAGVAPTLARQIRGWIERQVPQTMGAVGQQLARVRDDIKALFPDVQQRMRFYDKLLLRDASELARPGVIEAEVAAARAGKAEIVAGRVALVGAGPGDPELITLKAMRRIQQADVVLYDKLINPALLDYARRDAELVYVGKQGPRPAEAGARQNTRSFQQGAINDLIVTHARAGRYVVRLKGGDPFVYGRGGEELQVLMDTGIAVEIVPGITAAFGAASYAGIPLTHRDHAQSVRFVTGHRVENAVNLDWPELGKPDQTLVIYMGLVGLPQIVEKLLAYGADPQRPVALIENATLPQQRVVRGTLQNAVELVNIHDITGPTIVIVGDVARLGFAPL